MDIVEKGDPPEEWTIVRKKSEIKNERKCNREKEVEDLRLKNIALVKSIPYDVLPLYIGEVLTMESCVKGIYLGAEKQEIDPDQIPLGKYQEPLHFHTQCQCKACFIWDNSTRKYWKENRETDPLMRYQDDFIAKHLHVYCEDNKVYYSQVSSYKCPEEHSSLENFIDLTLLKSLHWKKWLSQAKNDTEKYLISLLLRENDPKIVNQYSTDWFSLLIRDRAPFTNDTIILYGVKDININASFMNRVEIPISEERFNELTKQCNFSLKPYRGCFTYFHVRLIRKRLLDLRYDEVKFPYKKEGENEGLCNKPFYLYGSNGTDVDVKFVEGILTIDIID